MQYAQSSRRPTEIVIGIIGPIGCNRGTIIETISKQAKHYNYSTEVINAKKLISDVRRTPPVKDPYKNMLRLMRAGNSIRASTKDDSIIAKLAAAKIREIRRTKENGGVQHEYRVIYIIDSLKRPDEVEELRNIYGRGFYLFAIHSSEETRHKHLESHCFIKEEARRADLIEKDKNDNLKHGHNTSDAFHLADFFVTENGNNEKVWNAMQRFMDVIFGDPFRTPTFHEYAMFMAYASSTRSADMSRQVGALIAKGTDIISTGANECPKAFGGTYWPVFNDEKNIIDDVPWGRDYTRGVDYNAREKFNIIQELKRGLDKKSLRKLRVNIENSGINDITEYGRVVHAEMDAILGCARRGVSCERAIIFCTTFPCHNCAKHIIASGIKQVIYIEPYPKSKASQMHDDAMECNDKEIKGKVLFIPFVGVGPRSFTNLFSMTLSAGEKIRRKARGSYKKAEWSRETAMPRVKMFRTSYLGNEKAAADKVDELWPNLKKSPPPLPVAKVRPSSLVIRRKREFTS